MHIYYLIDASIAEGIEGEEYLEEEEYFDHFTNQGKLSCKLPCKSSCKSHITHVLQMHVLEALLLLRENNWVRWKLVSVDVLKSIKLSLDSLVWDTIIMIPSYA